MKTDRSEQTLTARIFEIKRFAVHDGDGIRTTVFFKGCPLKCVWCHNPEGLLPTPQLAFYENKCVNCGECGDVCKQGVHVFSSGVSLPEAAPANGTPGQPVLNPLHLVNRENCISCGACMSSCPAEALTLYGKEVSVEDLLPTLLEDTDFYRSSGGGVTLSGGECLHQADFCASLLRALKAHGVSTAVDTCGFVPESAIEKVLPYTDVFLYDIKAFDEDVHLRLTGRSNRLILSNLRKIDAAGVPTEIRIPYVPGCNDRQMEKIAGFLSEFKNITGIRILPYHNYAGSKYRALSMENTLPPDIPTEEALKAARALMPFPCK